MAHEASNSMQEATNHDNLKDLPSLLHHIQSETTPNPIRSLSISLVSNLPPSSSTTTTTSSCSRCCYQLETGDKYSSLNINMMDHSHFSSVLYSLLSTVTSTVPDYSHLSAALRELHLLHLKWDDSQQMHSLVLLLQNIPTINHVVFAGNNFNNLDCSLSIFSDMLRKDDKLKEIIFSESHLGPLGATLLASALQINNSLEQIQIWDDSIGSRGAEELSKMIEVNSSLKTLTIFDSAPMTATPLLSAVLARNRPMELHLWTQQGRSRPQTKVAELLLLFVPDDHDHDQNNTAMITNTTTLRVYWLDESGSRRLAWSLGMNSTVRSLDLTGVRLKTKWAKAFRRVLEQNQFLRDVNISSTCLKDKGVVYIAAGLFKNKALKRLSLHGNWFGGIGVEHLLCPLSRFSALQHQANKTLNAITFGGKKTKIGRQGLSAILQMLTTNQSLTSMTIYDDESLRSEDFVKVFKNLETNATMKHLSLQGCKGVNGELLLQAIMSTLQVNPWLQDLDLARTPLQSFKDMPMVVPKSCRVFFCGQEHAGDFTVSITGSYPGMGNNKLLENLDASDLVRMMLKLELCYEEHEDASCPNSMLFIPSILEQGGGRRRWDFTMPDCVYVGRHMECDDSSSTFLTPGFFPLLISISINGIHVRVELCCGQIGYYIDILASSSTKTLTEIVNLFRHLIIPTIQGLCRPGMILMESVLRPDCVRDLTPPRYRKTQFVPLQRLKEALLAVPGELQRATRRKEIPQHVLLRGDGEVFKEISYEADIGHGGP